MTRDDIIRMAREAEIDPYDMCEDPRIAENSLIEFAALVAASEMEKAVAACRLYLNEDEPYEGFQNGVECCIKAIQHKEEFLEHMNKRRKE